MTTTNTPLLFLTGAGLPSWIWDDVRASLSPARPTAVAGHPSTASASLADHAQRVLDEVAWPRFVVVAHSIGGVVATALANRAPQRVDAILGIAAAVPAPGRSFLGSLPLPGRLVLGAVVRVVGTRPSEKAIRSGLTGGLDAPVADRIVADFAPAPRWLYRDHTPWRRYPDRRGYLFTSQDRELTLRQQEGFARELDATWRRTLASGHLPMLQEPEQFGMAIRDFCEADAVREGPSWSRLSDPPG